MSQQSSYGPAAGEEWQAMDVGGSLEVGDEGRELLRNADERIDQYRKGDCSLRLVDGRGRPVANRPVRIRQKGHDFPFGDQTAALDGMYRDGRWKTDRAEAWRQRFAEALNSATVLCYWTERPQNDLSKTEDRQGYYRIEHFAAVADWARATGLYAKGHPLFWSIPKCWPEWLYRYDARTQMKFAEMRVRSLLARFGDQVTTWDVVNEALWEPAPENLPERYWPHLEDLDRIAGYVGEVLDWAREERPENIYVLNDYGMEADKMRPIANDGREVNAGLQRERMLGILERLDKRGRMPNALGLQSHTGGLVDPAAQWQFYEQMAQAGIPLHITEFWANRRTFEELVDEAAAPGGTGSASGAGAGAASGSGAAASATAAKEREQRIEELRADYIERYMTVAFSHPSLEAFSFWGFMGSAIGWREGAAQWSPTTAAHSLGPVYTRVRDLINKKWRTEVSTRTDADGRVRFRGFGGDYAVDLGDSGYAGRFRLRARTENPITLQFPGTVRPPQ